MYTPQVSSVSRDSFSARASPRVAGRNARSAIRTPGVLKSSFTASPGLHASRIIEETPEFILESLGSPLPVLVTEVLASYDRCGEVSAQVSERGWCWLVCGRRLLIWRHRCSDGHRRVALCRELTLPPSDLAHSADLVQVLGGSDVHVPSCLAVSPEGTLRFWPSIIYESSSTESSADLQGEECERLVSLGEAGCLLATTTSTLVVVTWSAGLSCRRLAPPAALLAGIGRRVSSLIWGAIQPAGAEERLVSVRAAAEPESGQAGAAVYVLTARHLQKWSVDAAGAADRMEFQADLDRLARDSLLQTVWNRDTTSAEQLEVTLRDLWVTRHSILVLITARNPLQSNTTFFALGVLDENCQTAPAHWSRFDLLRHTTASDDGDGTELRMLAAGDRCFVHDRRQILCISLSAPSEPADAVRLSSPGERLIGWGLDADAAPLVFTSQHGLLRLTARGVPAADTSQTVNLSLLGLDGGPQLPQSFNVSLSRMDVDELTSSGDVKSQLRAACVLFCQNDLTRCSALVEELFPRHAAAGEDSELDRTVAALSRDIIDDFPTADPRWAEAAPHDATVSSTGSLILLHQLDDKREAHRLYVAFLKAVGLWGRLTGITSGDRVVDTSEVLHEHHEKVIAAMALTNLSAQLGQVVDAAVTRVVEERGEPPLRPLTAQDVFFRHLSAVDDIIGALIGREEELMSSGGSARDVVQLVAETNAILVKMLAAAAAARDESEPAADKTRERQPWSSAGPVRALLRRQHELTLTQALPSAEQGATRTSLYQQLLELTDLILSGYRVQLDSLRGTERHDAVQAQFEEDRYRLIQPLVEAEQYERATSLAEKYADFRILVEVCERTNSTERRNKYLTQFADQGFASFLFNWYLDQGRRGQLLSQCRRAELAGFLQQYRGLRWINELEAGRYPQAGETLEQCARAETEFLTRKKTYLSLSKLCALAGRQGADVEDHLTRLQPALELIQLQEQLPLSVLEAHGIDAETMRVLSPRELILLYVSPENVDANEFDFERALELAEWAELEGGDEERAELRLEIWCRAVLRDSWAGLDTDRPLEACRHTLLARTVQGLLLSGRQPERLLPEPGRLLACPQLGELGRDPSFAFLLRAIYEHAARQQEAGDA